MKKIYALIICFLFIFAVSCAVNPVTGRRELSLISESQEIQLGKQTDGQIRKQYGVYEDAALNNYVKNIGMMLTPLTHRYQLEYHFAVLDTPVVNAFAVPGGYIYVTRGILAMMNSEAELAVILGHELGHINARHSVKKMSQLMLVQLGMAVGSALNETFAKYSGLAGIGIQLIFLKFSRDDERQADALGVEYSRKADYNPAKMISFFTSLQKLGDLSGGHSLPGFLSTHPLTSERIKNVKAMLQEEDKGLNVKVNPFLQKLDNLVFGADPRQGYVEGNVFYHPLMRFYFSIPQGWKVQNTPSRVTMASQDGKAGIILQAENTSESLINYARKKASTIQGGQYISEQNTTINGMQSFHFIYDIEQQNGEKLRTRLSFIRKNEYIYSIMALSTNELFGHYDSLFRNTVGSFKKLTDKSHLNRKPLRLKLVRASGNQNLQEIFHRAGITQDLQTKLALFNGMDLTAVPPRNKLIKIVK